MSYPQLSVFASQIESYIS